MRTRGEVVTCVDDNGISTCKSNRWLVATVGTATSCMRLHSQLCSNPPSKEQSEVMTGLLVWQLMVTSFPEPSVLHSSSKGSTVGQMERVST